MSNTTGCALSKSSGCVFLNIGDLSSRHGDCVKRPKRFSGIVSDSGTRSGGGARGVSTGGLCRGSLQRSGLLDSMRIRCQSGSSSPGVLQRTRTETRCTSSAFNPLTVSSKPVMVRELPSGPKLINFASSWRNFPMTRRGLLSEKSASGWNSGTRCSPDAARSSPSAVAGGASDGSPSSVATSDNWETKPQEPSLIWIPCCLNLSKSMFTWPA
mmetsp:Transcript_56458/g.143740  ORF Transcript_56458/g.143740 Transcript_56458/m.143740 type:complete len:213 (-) Transcript_56458:379-1017(-)